MFRFSLNFSLCTAAALLLRSVPRYSKYNTTVTSFSFFGRLFGSVVGLQCEAEADEDIRERRRRSSEKKSTQKAPQILVRHSTMS